MLKAGDIIDIHVTCLPHKFFNKTMTLEVICSSDKTCSGCALSNPQEVNFSDYDGCNLICYSAAYELNWKGKPEGFACPCYNINQSEPIKFKFISETYDDSEIDKIIKERR